VRGVRKGVIWESVGGGVVEGPHVYGVVLEGAREDAAAACALGQGEVALGGLIVRAVAGEGGWGAVKVRAAREVEGVGGPVPVSGGFLQAC
jgi:hypothetical protein